MKKAIKIIAFYFLCMKAVKKNTLITSRCTRTRPLFSNWKDAKAFRNHEQTKCHKEAVQTVVALPKDYRDCAELLTACKGAICTKLQLVIMTNYSQKMHQMQSWQC